ncbi:polyadenylate-binding protein-interacting protein 9 isoform X2 [Citrus sinensis]|uniref:polyadenylate-binding protein-interacting protein 9 isoform X2 n=1 Tax=Citrus sinensis TaxID=2711 RepID=UPI000CED1803|nr:polyadenylate-binding protein-interacting protein 9 isoform X2 [Citrus sinensis]XP_024045648.1 polyadenylate-binding protein-interacting protein 9 isoform X2 [Citrus x clementina]
MAAVADMPGDAAAANNTNNSKNNNLETKKSESEFTVQKLVDMFTKLNPLAKEFFPSYYHQHTDHHFSVINNNFADDNKQSAIDNFNNNRRRRNNFNQGRKRLSGRAFRAQREDSVRRTVYVSDIDQNITEERLAGLFSSCGQVVDCRVCGDPHSVLRFAFVEFADEHGARAALNLGGTMLGYYPVRVLPSKTAILPVNPTFLPRSEDEREMCSRTVYCTNIDKKVPQAEVKQFFEAACGGEVTRLRLLGDHVHSTRIAFVEFAVYPADTCVCMNRPKVQSLR